MPDQKQRHDILIIGAGPIGIACGVEAVQHNLSQILLEKGLLTDAVFKFPTNLVFFSTAELLEVGDIPFLTVGHKPTRTEIVTYYKRVSEHFNLNVQLLQAATSVMPEEGGFRVSTPEQTWHARKVVLATGFYDNPKLLGVPGENLSKVSHYYSEPHPYYRRKIAIIGSGNSAVEAALELYRYGAEKVTVIIRNPGVNSSIKYWVKPDFENRVKEGSIACFFDTEVKEIQERRLVLQRKTGETVELENDAVLAMTGYHADFEFLQKAGVELEGELRRPVFDPATMETNIPGLYIAGVVAGGMNTNKIFIENGRQHAKLIVQHIMKTMD